MSDYYMVKLKKGQDTHSIMVTADDVEKAVDLALDRGIRNYKIYPKEWDEIETMYLGED